MCWCGWAFATDKKNKKIIRKKKEKRQRALQCGMFVCVCVCASVSICLLMVVGFSSYVSELVCCFSFERIKTNRPTGRPICSFIHFFLYCWCRITQRERRMTETKWPANREGKKLKAKEEAKGKKNYTHPPTCHTQTYKNAIAMVYKTNNNKKYTQRHFGALLNIFAIGGTEIIVKLSLIISLHWFLDFGTCYNCNW